jgi:benzoyl-CoA reductase/2-hydroxyglutaryl-CoA dehydratase subunit BcrC/BadD/HgdB
MKLESMDKLSQAAEQNLMDIENAKAAGRKVIGCYCLYSPMELAVAADAIPVPLCGTRNEPIAAAEEILPRNFCPLIKSSFGFAATDTCPYFRYSDLVIGDTTCDGKKKMFELLAEYRPMHILQLPHEQNSQKSLAFWRDEIETFKTVLEKTTGNEINNEKLAAAIRLMNKERMTKKALMDTAKTRPSPISGMDLLTIMFRTGFFADKPKGIALINEITGEIEERISRKESPFSVHTPRILMTGVPVGIGSDKLVRVLEESGANVVCFENCSGYKQAYTVDEAKEPLQALAEQYLSIPCSVMSPNQGRFDLLSEMIREFSIDGVVDLTWQGCHTYNVEAYSVGKFVKDKHGLPYLHLESDYSESDTGQLKIRVEAFLEIIR